MTSSVDNCGLSTADEDLDAGGASATLGSGAGIKARGADGEAFTVPLSGEVEANAGFGTGVLGVTAEGAGFGAAGVDSGRVAAIFGCGVTIATSAFGAGGNVLIGSAAPGSGTRGGEAATTLGAGVADGVALRADRGGSPVRRYEVVAQFALLPVGAKFLGNSSRKAKSGWGAVTARVDGV
ncbi:MAG: hypothetical protein H7A55_04545 [Verrucomicrobiaceae bacterium]|nr:hypothetical protein [Verrucomicrobiaceae bacterium]